MTTTLQPEELAALSDEALRALTKSLCRLQSILLTRYNAPTSDPADEQSDVPITDELGETIKEIRPFTAAYLTEKKRRGI